MTLVAVDFFVGMHSCMHMHSYIVRIIIIITMLYKCA